MLFRDLKQNYPVWVLDRDEMTVRQGKVTSVSFPRMEVSQPTAQSRTVVDVGIEIDGKNTLYNMPDNLSVTYAGQTVIAVEKQGLLGEVEAMRATAQQVLASIDRQRDVLSKTDALLAELNPQYKEKQELEKRFGAIEGSVAEMKEMLSGLVKSLK